MHCAKASFIRAKHLVYLTPDPKVVHYSTPNRYDIELANRTY
jgi:hypothetical protein